MVPLPLFKLATLFVRHISKYGAGYYCKVAKELNRIKNQAHHHPSFRSFAARYGQMIHQLNMRMSVIVLRDANAEARAREKAEAPTVKTREQVEREEALLAKHGQNGQSSHHHSPAAKKPPQSIWRRKFRVLPDDKAVDLFADVVGDAFILAVAAALIIYEYWRASSRPDHNLERIRELDREVEELKARERELERDGEWQKQRFEALESALRELRDPKTKRPLLPPGMLRGGAGAGAIATNASASAGPP